MMLKTKSTILAVIVSIFFFTQATAQKNHQVFNEWPALKTFHEVMSNTYHQSQESNFKPIRERSSELHDKAVKLAASKIPVDLDQPAIRKAIKELESETKQLNAMVQKKASDDELRKMLETTHDTFHKIVGLCTKDDHHEPHSK